MNSEYGTYGVLRFLKKNDDSNVVASYPIDDETLTFGKGGDCNIRLYYPAVSQLHAKIIFKDRKVSLICLVDWSGLHSNWSRHKVGVLVALGDCMQMWPQSNCHTNTRS